MPGRPPAMGGRPPGVGAVRVGCMGRRSPGRNGTRTGSLGASRTHQARTGPDDCPGRGRWKIGCPRTGPVRLPIGRRRRWGARRRRRRRRVHRTRSRLRHNHAARRRLAGQRRPSRRRLVGGGRSRGRRCVRGCGSHGFVGNRRDCGDRGRVEYRSGTHWSGLLPTATEKPLRNWRRRVRLSGAAQASEEQAEGRLPPEARAESPSAGGWGGSTMWRAWATDSGVTMRGATIGGAGAGGLGVAGLLTMALEEPEAETHGRPFLGLFSAGQNGLHRIAGLGDLGQIDFGTELFAPPLPPPR